MEWQAYYNLEPFGQDAYYLGCAIVACTVANANRGKNQKPFEVKDFMPKFEKQEQTPEQMIQFAQMMTAAMAGPEKPAEMSVQEGG